MNEDTQVALGYKATEALWEVSEQVLQQTFTRCSQDFFSA